mmetsp:Transcript_51760/g.135036  ORF Transcript_51760/g.135036 Transcript_51760/m.135036 type:complete len:160 (+) Transcript_51760:379-858(+)
MDQDSLSDLKAALAFAAPLRCDSLDQASCCAEGELKIISSDSSDASYSSPEDITEYEEVPANVQFQQAEAPHRGAQAPFAAYTHVYESESLPMSTVEEDPFHDDWPHWQGNHLAVLAPSEHGERTVLASLIKRIQQADDDEIDKLWARVSHRLHQSFDE